MIVVFVVVLSAASWLFIGVMMDELHVMLRLVMCIVGILAIVIMSNRDLYLPFLGATAFPSTILVDTPNRGNVILSLDGLPPSVKVVFWAANSESGGIVENPQAAYSSSVNGGVVTASEEGIAHITLDCPQQYKVNRLGIDKVLPKHVHFRYALPGGLFSPVLTRDLSELCPM